ncbi:MAG: tyrosine-type recombinase/integrase [Caulobacterales bacterium]
MPKGLKPVRKRLATGEVRLYWYHRATGKRLGFDPQSAEGLLEVRALDDRAKIGAAAAEAASGSYAQLWAKYRESPEWRNLKPRTRSDYQAVRDWLGEAAERRRIATLTPGMVYGLRDKAAAEKGRRFGNYVVQVLRLTLAWGRDRGLCADNPAREVKAIRKPTGAATVNRAWTAAELEAFAADAPAQLLTPFALGLFAGMRQGDALRATWSAYDGVALRWIAGKNGEAGIAPATGVFKAILDAAKERRGKAVQIAVNSAGRPWTQSGFRASFFKRLRELRRSGAVSPGCTFHGLRHTIATMARDGAESEFRIAAAIGDRSTAMAAIYGRDADRAGAQAAILESVQKRFENADWKPHPR